MLTITDKAAKTFCIGCKKFVVQKMHKDIPSIVITIP